MPASSAPAVPVVRWSDGATLRRVIGEYAHAKWVAGPMGIHPGFMPASNPTYAYADSTGVVKFIIALGMPFSAPLLRLSVPPPSTTLGRPTSPSMGDLSNELARRRLLGLMETLFYPQDSSWEPANWHQRLQLGLPWILTDEKHRKSASLEGTSAYKSFAEAFERVTLWKAQEGPVSPHTQDAAVQRARQLGRTLSSKQLGKHLGLEFARAPEIDKAVAVSGPVTGDRGTGWSFLWQPTWKIRDGRKSRLRLRVTFYEDWSVVYQMERIRGDMPENFEFVEAVGDPSDQGPADSLRRAGRLIMASDRERWMTDHSDRDHIALLPLESYLLLGVPSPLLWENDEFIAAFGTGSD